MILDYEELATGRVSSLFQSDIDRNRARLSNSLVGCSVAVIGAAGSIGSAVVKSILDLQPATMALIDLNENNLVELVRDLRASGDVSLPRRFSALPIGLGTPECGRFFAEAPAFDYVFNLSAVKHVRSEKDVYSLMRMVDTNILFLDDLLASLPRARTKIFSVSTDKATNPVSLMGASKRVMEMVLLRYADVFPFSTARFANVAFSDGSLPFAILRRIEKRQPIAAPNDVRRFFMSHGEAGQLCLLAGILGNNRETFFPKLERSTDEKTFAEIAVAVLRRFGFEAYECDSEEEAKSKSSDLIAAGKWPCLFAGSDTSGEKQYEEFVAPEDAVDWERFDAIGVIEDRRAALDVEGLESFLGFARAARHGRATKADYVEAFRSFLPEFRHVETGKSLDEKL